MSLFITNARVVTGAPGAAPVERADVLVGGIGGEKIEAIEPAGSIAPPADRVIDARGRVLCPAFVDAHTHACWAGDRFDEFERKQQGASYLEILAAGGGIMSTVRAVRRATQDELACSLRARLDVMLREGTASVEVKSGYGLTTTDELKMLCAIAQAAEGFPGRVLPTALLGHALDPDRPDYIETTIDETLPAVSEAFPGIAVDAYCEEGAWSHDDCARLFTRAAELGHPVRVHADQFNRLGMTAWAAERGALSVDHLEASSRDDLRTLAQSGAFAVALPASGFHLDDRYADARAVLDFGGRLVIATNCNPGSAPTSSMPFAVALAVRKLGLTAAEAITACTSSAAALLGLTDRGVVAPGMWADLVLLRHTDERALGYDVGGDPVDVVVCAGEVVKER